MDPVTLMHQAREAGLTVIKRGQRLIVRGPTDAEGLAALLLENKASVMQMLAQTGQQLSRQHSVAIGDRVVWTSSAFGIRTGHVAMSLPDGWAVVRSDIVPSSLTLLHHRDIRLTIPATMQWPSTTSKQGKSKQKGDP